MASEGRRGTHVESRGESKSMIRTSLTLPRGSLRSIDGKRRTVGYYKAGDAPLFIDACHSFL